MQIRHITIRGFRGINSMEWSIPVNFIYCLIGPGDSTKSTILDAIEWTLSPRWNIPVYDSDFYLCLVDTPIDIRITIGGLPDSYLAIEKYGLYTRGWKDGLLFDEPLDDCEEVITVQLFIDRSLEPKWVLYTDRTVDKPRSISSKEREGLGMTRLGPYVDRQLSWGYGSALTRLTDKPGDTSSVLAEANRNARSVINSGNLPHLKEVADLAKVLGEYFGVSPSNEYNPALDPASANESIGGITLCDGQIPLRQSGLGTRRLLALALQQNCVKTGSIQLIDEIEQGLEPHRVRHLLHALYMRLSEKTGNKNCQIFLTTHSRDVIEELVANDLWVVKSCGGITIVQQVPMELQGTVRAASGAFLARKIIVCEGKTEFGICRALNYKWAAEDGGKPFAHLGVVAIDGVGSNGSIYADSLRKLGYEVAYFADSDRDDLKISLENLSRAGINVIVWDDKLCTEQRIFNDIPWERLQELLDLATANHGTQSVLGIIAARFKSDSTKYELPVINWINFGHTENDIRKSLGCIAKDGKWFKRIDYGEQLGEFIYSCLSEIVGTDTEKKISTLRNWCYEKAG